MSVGQAFDRSVAYYDEWVKTALPAYEKIFATALALIPFDRKMAIDVLDLGAGTGLFSHRVLEAYPQASFVLYDLAAKMLHLARERFQDHQDRFEYILGDYRHFQGESRYNLVISSLSIHHLTDDEKQELFSRIYQSLQDEGVFINVDQIKAPTAAMERLYWETWLQHLRAKGAAEERIQASIERRKRYDRDALLVDQLAWLSQAGFETVDCVYKQYFVGVFFAQRA